MDAHAARPVLQGCTLPQSNMPRDSLHAARCILVRSWLWTSPLHAMPPCTRECTAPHSQVLATHNWPKSPTYSGLHPFIGERSMLVAPEHTWAKQRSSFNPAFQYAFLKVGEGGRGRHPCIGIGNGAGTCKSSSARARALRNVSSTAA